MNPLEDDLNEKSLKGLHYWIRSLRFFPEPYAKAFRSAHVNYLSPFGSTEMKDITAYNHAHHYKFMCLHAIQHDFSSQGKSEGRTSNERSARGM